MAVIVWRESKTLKLGVSVILPKVMDWEESTKIAKRLVKIILFQAKCQDQEAINYPVILDIMSPKKMKEKTIQIKFPKTSMNNNDISYSILNFY